MFKVSVRLRPIRVFARISNVLAVPVMYLVSGTFREKPQKTHPWNRVILSPDEASRLDGEIMVHCEGVKAIPRHHWWSLMFHMPILGGWCNYVVLRPRDYEDKWHIGWSLPSETAVSQFLLTGPVRMLLGSEDVSFFGLAPEGVQVSLDKIGDGVIGAGGPYKKIPLL